MRLYLCLICVSRGIITTKNRQKPLIHSLISFTLVMSLLTWCGHIPSHCLLSITFSLSQIHHHVTCLCNSLYNTCEPLWPLVHNTHPHWFYYQLHHQTGFVYGMYRWPIDLTVTFPSLDGSLCCFSDDISLFLLYWSHTMVHNSSGQLPNSPCHGPTGCKSLHHTVSESGAHCCFAMDDHCAHFSLTSLFVFNHLYCLHTTEKISPRVWI